MNPQELSQDKEHENLQMNLQEPSQDKILEMQIDDQEPSNSIPDIPVHDNLKEDEIQTNEQLSSTKESVEEEFEAPKKLENYESF